jgi:hypothetical protein
MKGGPIVRASDRQNREWLSLVLSPFVFETASHFRPVSCLIFAAPLWEPLNIVNSIVAEKLSKHGADLPSKTI